MAKTPVSFDLPEEATQALEQMLRRGSHSTRRLTRARLLLKLASGVGPSEVSRQLGVCKATVYNVRNKAVNDGWQVAIEEAPRSGRPREITPEQRARITALSCTSAPTGHARWSLRLLADRIVELDICENISHEGVRDILKKMNSSRI